MKTYRATIQITIEDAKDEDDAIAQIEQMARDLNRFIDGYAEFDGEVEETEAA
jgi:hypothetical protein